MHMDTTASTCMYHEIWNYPGRDRLRGLVDVPRRQRDNGRAIARRKPGVLLLFPLSACCLTYWTSLAILLYAPYYAYELGHYVCI